MKNKIIKFLKKEFTTRTNGKTFIDVLEIVLIYELTKFIVTLF